MFSFQYEVPVYSDNSWSCSGRGVIIYFKFYNRHNPVGTRYCGDIGFLLDLHRDIDRLRFEIEVTSLNDIFFQHHNDLVVITYYNVKLQVRVIPIFNVVLISDKDENAINKDKHFVLFHLSKYSDKVYGNIIYKKQIENEEFH